MSFVARLTREMESVSQILKNTETYRRTAGAELAEIGYLHVAEIAAGAGK